MEKSFAEEYREKFLEKFAQPDGEGGYLKDIDCDREELWKFIEDLLYP